jgi:hypothetical protein
MTMLSSASLRGFVKGVTCQDLFNPGSGFFGRLEQGRVTNVAFAEPSFQVPQPLVMRTMPSTCRSPRQSWPMRSGSQTCTSTGCSKTSEARA